jgi:hypothetical protein
MKQKCRICKRARPLNSGFYYFRNSTGKHDTVCKECRREKARKRDQELREANDPGWRAYRRKAKKKRIAILREAVNDIKKKPCLDCGRSLPYYVMHFDHLDGSIKDGNVSHMVSQGIALQKILDEIAKCELVCANCHGIRTYQRNKASRRP